MAIGEEAQSFLENEASWDEKDMGHVTQKKYMEFMASRGCSKQDLEKFYGAHEELVNGMYRVASARLTEKVKTARKEDRDPSRETAGITINCPNGSISYTQRAAKTYPIPKEPGKTVTRYCVGTLEFNQKRLMDKGLCMDTEQAMIKQLGLQQ